uniref:Uncharacterized protein n=1 Tax=Vespula pensylvanica TaxID=30213 RepID=A0A834K271_VESPE|nr:hypothetical protein H0235_016736 [Vespula pensylvanica]
MENEKTMKPAQVRDIYVESSNPHLHQRAAFWTPAVAVGRFRRQLGEELRRANGDTATNRSSLIGKGRCHLIDLHTSSGIPSGQAPSYRTAHSRWEPKRAH